MEVRRGPASKGGWWTNILRETKKCYVWRNKGGAPTVAFVDTETKIKNLNGRYRVQAILTLADVATILTRLLDKTVEQPDLLPAIATAFRDHEAALLRLAVLVTNENLSQEHTEHQD